MSEVSKIHSKKTSVPFEIGSLIQSNTKLDDDVRQIALEIAQKLPFDASKIAKECLEIVQFPMLTSENYQQALIWARALNATEPESARSRSLIGAALFRAGHIQDAYEIVKSNGRSGLEVHSIIRQEQRRTNRFDRVRTVFQEECISAKTHSNSLRTRTRGSVTSPSTYINPVSR